MAYRFTNTDKWGDSWFSGLKPNEKLLFNYMCDMCDVGGFIEINKPIWSAYTGLTLVAVEGAIEGLERGIIMSSTEDCIYIRNFLKHQKNLPLNENNNAHKGIYKRFELYSHKFDIQDIDSFILGASEGLLSPIGKGKGNGKGKGKGKKEEKQAKEIGPCLMKNSGVTIDDISKAFLNTKDLKQADPEYYFQQVTDWSSNKDRRGKDWVAAIRSWARRDLADGKLKLLPAKRKLLLNANQDLRK